MTNVYRLRNGHSVATRKIADERTEFETRNPAGEVISTVTLGRTESRELITDLRTAVLLRKV